MHAQDSRGTGPGLLPERHSRQLQACPNLSGHHVYLSCHPSMFAEAQVVRLSDDAAGSNFSKSSSFVVHLQAGTNNAIQLTKIRVTFSGLSDQPLPHKTPSSFAHLTNQQEPSTPPASHPRSCQSGVKAPSPRAPAQPNAGASSLLQPPTQKPAAIGLPAQPISSGEGRQGLANMPDSSLMQQMQTENGKASCESDPAAAAASQDGMQHSRSSTQPLSGEAAATAAAAAPEHRSFPAQISRKGPHAAGQPPQRMQLTIRSASQIQLQRGDRRAMSGSLVEPGVMRSPIWNRSRVLADSSLQDHARRAALAAADEAEVAASQAAALAAANETEAGEDLHCSHRSCSPGQPHLPAAEPWSLAMSQLARRPSSIAGT